MSEASESISSEEATESVRKLLFNRNVEILRSRKSLKKFKLIPKPFFKKAINYNGNLECYKVA